MNKYFVILLAVCLANVHAFVKRDTAQKTEPNALEQLQKNFEDMTKTFGDKLSETFDPEKVKQAFNGMVDNISKAIDEVKPKSEAPKQ